MNKPESSIESAAITKSAALVVEVFLVASTETSFSYLYRRNHLRGAFTEDFPVAAPPRKTRGQNDKPHPNNTNHH